MDMHGVRVFCLVDELPDFGGVEFGKLGGGLVPVLVVDEHDHGVLEAVLILVEGDGAGGDCGGFGDAFDCAKGLRNRKPTGWLRRSGWRRGTEYVEGSGAEVDRLASELAEVDQDIGAFGWGPGRRTSALSVLRRRPWSLPI